MQLPKRKLGKYAQGDEDFVMSKSKYDEIEREVEKLNKKQPGAAKEVSRLAELGDFSENVEYQIAKGRLRGIMNAILKLENQLKNAEVVEHTGKSDTVSIGSTVTISDAHKDKIYTILGALEVDLDKGIISHNSPIGVALLGKKVGDSLEFRGTEYKVVSVE
ncbi:transcription elongation factor GreA [Candidatus Parcubacteria bacterium]|nr:MAG: transcription elongation factor GreA [Candidatus Parcubacteria bacterium]